MASPFNATASSSSARFPKICASRPIKRRLQLGRVQATILIGDAEESFTVHRELIARSSKFFEKALKGKFLESHGTVPLKDANPQAFEVYLQWLYTGLVFTDVSVLAPPNYALLANCLVLGDLIQDFNFYNCCVDSIIDQAEQSCRYPVMIAKQLYEDLPPSSPVQQLVVHYWAYLCDTKWFEAGHRDVQDAPAEFWAAVSRILAARVENKTPHPVYPWKEDRCQYHVHEKSLMQTSIFQLGSTIAGTTSSTALPIQNKASQEFSFSSPPRPSNTTAMNLAGSA